MPALINLALNILLGAGVVLVLRRSQALHDQLLSWAFFVLLAFEMLLVTPITAYLFRFYPQWSMLYLFDPQIYADLDRAYGWMSLLAVLLNVVAGIAGFVALRMSLITRQTWIAASAIGCAIGLLLTVAFLHGERVIFIGDYDEFWQGNALFLLRTLPGWLGLWLYLLAGLLVYGLHRYFADHDPRLL